jgi:hypothetical protein
MSTSFPAWQRVAHVFVPALDGNGNSPPVPENGSRRDAMAYGFAGPAPLWVDR